MLLRPRGNFVGLTLVAYQEVGGYRQSARTGADHVAEIAETVVIGVGRDGRIEPRAIPGRRSGKRDGWMLSVRIIGVGCGQS